MKCLQKARLWTIYGTILILNTAGIATSGDSSSDESTQSQRARGGTTPEETFSVGIPVEITISAQHLPRDDGFGFSKSDPMCVLRTKEPGSSEWVVYQRTERIKDELNPKFNTKIQMNYKFEDAQPLRFELYDVDDDEELSNLKEQKLMAFVECHLGKLVSQRKVTMKLRHKNFLGKEKDSKSTIHLEVTELTKNNYEEVFLRLSGRDLADEEWFGKSDPFIKIQNVQGQVIRTTEVKKNDLNPVWRPLHLPVKTLCGDNYDEPLIFSCWDSNSVEAHELIGEFRTTLNELRAGATEFNLINEGKRKHNRSNQSSGRIHVETEIKTVHSLMEYFEGGLKIRCTIAIDFSASNGDAKDSNSLHHINKSKDTFNQYEQAIQSIVDTLESYTTEIPVYGFGARVGSEDRDASQDFLVTMDSGRPACAGVQEILSAYRSCVPKIHFDRQAKLAPIIRRLKDNIQTQNNEYHVLVILTRGSISDLDETTETIIQASQLPMSIIVIGVGEDRFKVLRRALRAETLQRNGEGAQRDMVEFVPFNRFLAGGGDLRTAGAQLARKALSQIPEHITSFKVSAA